MRLSRVALGQRHRIGPFAPTSCDLVKKLIVSNETATADRLRGDFYESIGERNTKHFKQRLQRDRFTGEVIDQYDKIFYNRQFSAKRLKQESQDEGGLEAALQNWVAEDRPTYKKAAMERPLDRNILEELYKEQHGKRFERTLAEGQNWEHWLARDERTLPVRKGSRFAREAFGFGGKVELLEEARSAQGFPVSKIPEVAFWGPTGSGKSSIINSLVNSFVCRYGELPGTTRTVNFYNVSNRVTLVDMPGDGFYHSMLTSELEANNARKTAKEYLIAGSPNRHERNLKCVYYCLPRAVLRMPDFKALKFLNEHSVPFSILITKSDDVSIRELARKIDIVRCEMVHYKTCNAVLISSALRLAGIAKLQNHIASVALDGRNEKKDPIISLIDDIVD